MRRAFAMITGAACAACADVPPGWEGTEGAVRAADEAMDTGGYDIAPMIFQGRTSAEGAVVAVVDIVTGAVCSGTAIRQDIILTAAHCLDGVRMTDVLEGGNLAAPRRRYAVARTVMHPNYNRFTLDNDLGVVFLATPFRGPLLQIGLPGAGLGQAPLGASLRVAGFGLDENGVRGVRREADVTLLSVAARTAIASNTAAGLCDGDSGGPLIARIGGRDRAVGVASAISPVFVPFGNPCAGDGIYTRVDAYLAWLSTL
jgi:secreted trypsin-like serine protease